MLNIGPLRPNCILVSVENDQGFFISTRSLELKLPVVPSYDEFEILLGSVMKTNVNCILFQGLSGSIPKGYNTPKCQLLKDCTRFHRFTKGSQIIKMATRTQHVFQISLKRPSALLNSYVIPHSPPVDHEEWSTFYT